METYVALAPVQNALNSLSLLHQHGSMPACNEWVGSSAGQLSSEKLGFNQLLFEHLRGALEIDGEWDDFPAYLDALAARPAPDVQQQARAWLGETQPPAAAQALLDNPAALHEAVVAHLRELWDAVLAREWQQVQPQLARYVAALSNNYRVPQWKQSYAARSGQPAEPSPGAPSVQENLHALLRPDTVEGVPATQPRVVYVPSAHVGRYIIQLNQDAQQWVFFEAGRTLPAVLRSSPVGDTELVERLEGLADESRLQALELFSERDTLTAQDLIERLQLSQSNTSRLLKSLQHYLMESRGKGAGKRYQFSPVQVEVTFRAVRERLNRRNAEIAFDDTRLQRPEPLRRYMNAQGLLQSIPSRHAERMAALALIASGLEHDQRYTEKAINAHIQQAIDFEDFVTVRRMLCDYGFLGRERDGSLYWLRDLSTNKAAISS